MSDLQLEAAPAVSVRTSALDDKAWEMLLRRISLGKFTPFLGPESCFGPGLSSSKIAMDWAQKYAYPLEDDDDLTRVAQYMTYNEYGGDGNAVKDLLVEEFRSVQPPNFSDPNEPHRVLASLPIKIYINTHYLGFTFEALKHLHKDPRQIYCRWYAPDESKESGLAPGYEPTVANPLVYNLFGHISESESLVLTEDDYLDFLGRTAEDPELLPQPVQSAMVNHSLLFLGYQMTELDFRVLLRSVNNLWHRKQLRTKGTHLSVQMVHVGDHPAPEQLAQVKSYFGNYCQELSIGVYWGSTREFVSELRQRWEDYCARSVAAR